MRAFVLGQLDPDCDPALLAHFGDRNGFYKPAEGGTRLAELEGWLQDDLARYAAIAR